MFSVLLVNALVAGVAAYVLICLTMYLFQDKLVFPRHSVEYTQYADYGLSEDMPIVERFTLPTSDGKAVLDALWLKPEEGGEGPENDSPAPLIIGFGGNAQDNHGHIIYLRRLYGPKVHYAAFQYRGYGNSTGKPSQRALYEDTLQFYDVMMEKLREGKSAKGVRTIAVGNSIGTALATYLSAHRELEGLVVFAPFTSAVELARKVYPWLPVKMLMRHPFPSYKFLKKNNTPTVVFYGGQDTIVPPAQTERYIAHLTHLEDTHFLPSADHANLSTAPEIQVLFPQALDKWLSK